MTKNELGAYVFAAIGGVGPVLVWFKDAIAKVLGVLRVSFVAMWQSRAAVWAAVLAIAGACYWGGFWLGHRAGGADVPDLTAQVSALKADAAKAKAEAARLKARIAELEAPKSETPTASTQPAQIPPVAAVSRRPLSRLPKPQPAASAPVKPFKPFGD